MNILIYNNNHKFVTIHCKTQSTLMSLNQEQTPQQTQPEEILPRLIKAIETALSEPGDWESVEHMACKYFQAVCRVKMEDRDRNMHKEEAEHWTRCIQRAAKTIDAIRGIWYLSQRIHAQWTPEKGPEEADSDKFYETITNTIETEYPRAKRSLVAYSTKLQACLRLNPPAEGCNTVENMHQEDSLPKPDGANAPETYTLELISLLIWALDISVREASKLTHDIGSAMNRILDIEPENDRKNAYTDYLLPLYLRISKIASQTKSLIKLIKESPYRKKKATFEQQPEFAVCKEVEQIAWEIIGISVNIQTTAERLYQEILGKNETVRPRIGTHIEQIETSVQKIYQQATENLSRMHEEIKQMIKINTATNVRPKRSSAPDPLIFG
jgi:hypothetical protein